ncbi:MAG TPA: gas vesicle protein GvpG [Methanothrix sp.]|jgi:cell shape-determining protein MreC|nr:gas vesicle protein GvpG [Methanothrix sp.]
MFFIDDLLLRSVGISLPGLDMIWTLEQIQRYAYKEMYNSEKIKNQIKETRLLYEFGELERQEYERKNAELMQKLELAQRLSEMNHGIKMDLLGL